MFQADGCVCEFEDGAGDEGDVGVRTRGSGFEDVFGESSPTWTAPSPCQGRSDVINMGNYHSLGSHLAC